LVDLSVSKYFCVITSYTKVGGRRIGPCTTIQKVSRSTILSNNLIVKKFVGFTLNAELKLSTYLLGVHIAMHYWKSWIDFVKIKFHSNENMTLHATWIELIENLIPKLNCIKFKILNLMQVHWMEFKSNWIECKFNLILIQFDYH
jgi:hypothetical protein